MPTSEGTVSRWWHQKGSDHEAGPKQPRVTSRHNMLPPALEGGRKSRYAKKTALEPQNHPHEPRGGKVLIPPNDGRKSSKAPRRGKRRKRTRQLFYLGQRPARNTRRDMAGQGMKRGALYIAPGAKFGGGKGTRTTGKERHEASPRFL